MTTILVLGRALLGGEAFDIVRCGSPEEVRARLSGTRRYAAVALDGGMPGIDRDLIESARQAEATVIVIKDRRVPVDWEALGADHVLEAECSSEELAAAIEAGAGRVDREAQDRAAPLIAVCGSGGTGASTVAAAIAQGFASNATEDSVLLADLVRAGDQAMLHDVDAVAPCISDVVEAHRTGSLDRGALIGLTLPTGRGYRLLTGLRRPRAWTAIPPRAFDATLASLRRGFNPTVCDIDSDFEGEDDGGSRDVEERNHMSRSCARGADAVIVVLLPGVKGAHAGLRVVLDLVAHGIGTPRLTAVLNRTTSTDDTTRFDALLRDHLGPAEVNHVVELPELGASAEHALLTGRPLPADLVDPLTSAVAPLLSAPRERAADPPRRVVPGTLGSLSPEE